MPHPINERLNGNELQERIVQQSKLLGNDGSFTDLAIENVAFQQMLIEVIQEKGIHVDGISPGGNDKRARLISISELIRSGRILFPKHGSEKLIEQVVGFEMEKHDDLSDALVILVSAVMAREKTNSFIIPRKELPKIITTQQAEKEIDQEIMQKSEVERSGYDAGDSKKSSAGRTRQKVRRRHATVRARHFQWIHEKTFGLVKFI